MKKLGTLALSMALFCGAASAADAVKTITPGTLTAAISANYPPIDFKDPATGKLTGLDVDLAEALAQEMGLKLVWQEMGFEQMSAGLTTGRVDAIISGMSDIPDRHAVMDFVDYLVTGPQFYILSSNAATIKEPTDLCGKAIGTSRRTNFPKIVAEWSQKHCVDAGKPAIEVKGTEGSADARAQLKQGRVMAAVQGSETIPYAMALDPNVFQPVGDALTTEYTGIATAKGNTDLHKAIGAALEKLVASKKYHEILAKWSLDKNAIQKVTYNLEGAR